MVLVVFFSGDGVAMILVGDDCDGKRKACLDSSFDLVEYAYDFMELGVFLEWCDERASARGEQARSREMVGQ